MPIVCRLQPCWCPLLRGMRTEVSAPWQGGPPARASDPASHQTTERRQLTVMFCDLVGSTALSARLGPEDLRDIIGAYHRSCSELVERHGGFVAKYMATAFSLTLATLKRMSMMLRMLCGRGSG
jgi:class 3 adenylate cyclase